jgi:hypothetical protein
VHLAFLEWQLLQANLTRRRGRETAPLSPSPCGDDSWPKEQVKPRRSQLAHDVPSPGTHLTFLRRQGWQVFDERFWLDVRFAGSDAAASAASSAAVSFSATSRLNSSVSMAHSPAISNSRGISGMLVVRQQRRALGGMTRLLFVLGRKPESLKFRLSNDVIRVGVGADSRGAGAVENVLESKA